MQKKRNSIAAYSGCRIIKYLLMMKLVIILSLIFSFQAFAVSSSAQKINIHLKDVSVESALKAIEAQGNYRFVYKTEILPKDKLVNVSAEEASLSYVMGRILNNTVLSYEVINNSLVVIVPREIVKAKVVSGKVTDINGNPLSGVSILEKGTTNGTASREDGTFTLTVSAQNVILVFSSLGYLSKEVKVSDNMLVTLEKTDAELDQVVVVGYGTQKKINLTGAVSSVDFDKQSMNSRAVSNVSSALAGMASGVSVRQSSGLPSENNNAALSVRGVGSLNISSAPLVLIDGQVGDINSVSPNDVASVSILKDAASAAIYGSRASNGVILITTKTGKGAKGKVNFSYNGYTGSKTPTLLPDYIYYTPDHMRISNMAEQNDDLPPVYTETEITDWEEGMKTDPYGYPSTNWWDALLKKNIITNHNISARGGSDKVNFYTSMDYYKDDGMIDNSGFKRINFRNNLTYNVNKWFKLGSNASYLSSKAGPLVINDVFQWFRAVNPGVYPRHPDGRYGAPSLPNASGDRNPLYDAQRQRGETNSNRFMGKIFGTIDPLPGLTITGSYFADIFHEDSWNGSQPSDLWNFRTNTIVDKNEGTPLVLTNGFLKSRREVADLYADYTKSFGKHNGHILVGYNQEYFKRSNFSGTRQDLLSYETPVLNAATGEITNLTGNATDFAMRSYFGRFNYNFDSKYLFEANLRYDGSSRFAPDKRWGLFPSASVGWVISRENFFQPLSNIFTNLKFRASYGELGNNGIDNYDWQSFYEIVKHPFNETSTSGLRYNQFGNADITWESTVVTNIGLDARLFNKVDLSLSYYNKLTKNILASLAIPSTNGGITAPLVNSAKVSNSGFEAEASASHRFGKLNMHAAVNFGYNKNRILSYRGSFIQSRDGGVNAAAWTEGYPIGIFWVREVDRIIQTQQEVDDLVAQGYTFAPATPGPGDFLYKDANGDKKINDDDRVLKGNPIPLYTYGGNISLDYAGVDFSIYFSGVGKWDRYLTSAVWMLAHQQGYVWPQAYLNAWTPTNTNTDIPKVYRNKTVNNQTSDFFLYKADYFKIRSLQLGYSLPGSVIKKIGLNKLRVFANLENYFTWTDWPNLDPESTRSQDDDVTYPLGRVASVGLQLNF